MIRIAIECAAFYLIQGVMLFGSAGTWDWPAAWVYLGIQVLTGLAALVVGDREMLVNRSQWEADARRWDVILASISALLFWAAPLVVAGLDVGRFHWTPPLPIWVTVFAFLLHAAGLALGVWAMASNRYFTKFVSVRRDGHDVISSGPYAIVRHPGYAGALPAFAALPLALGTLWGLIPAAAGLGLLVLRTSWEDQALRRELPGYTAYSAKVRFRLIPGVW